MPLETFVHCRFSVHNCKGRTDYQDQLVVELKASHVKGEARKMLRHWKLLSSHLNFGHLYPATACKETVRHAQVLHKQTFVSLCGGCYLQIEKFRIPFANNKSTLNREVHSRSHEAESVKPNIDVDVTSSKIADVISNHSQEVNSDWTVHERLITACSGLWEDSPDGSNFIVSYVDTASQLTKTERSRMPTVLAVARDLAHSDSLKPLLECLTRSGFRVIMPYLVGSELTRGLAQMDEDRFSQMLGERSAFLLDFLSSTGVHRFDVALGHCLECFPILTLASGFQLFDSVVFICPIPGHVAPRWIRPLKISLKMIDWFRSSIFWPLASLYFRTYVRQKVSAYPHATARELHLCVEIAHGINYDTVSGFAAMFESSRTPILYVYCDADPMVDSKLSGEFAEIFGIDSDLTDSYDAEGQLVEKATGSSGRYAKALRFSAPTHFPHTEKHLQDVILKELKELHSHALSKRTGKPAS